MDEFKKRILYGGIGILMLFIIGTYFYHEKEGLRTIDALYLTAMTITTVGYGDFHPSTDEGKIFTIFLSFSGIAIALYFFAATQLYFLRLMDNLYQKITSQLQLSNHGIKVENPIIIPKELIEGESPKRQRRYKYTRKRRKK